MNVSTSPASKPSEIRTTAPARLVPSGSEAVSAPSTAVAGAFSVYVVAPALVATIGVSSTFVTVTVKTSS